MSSHPEGWLASNQYGQPISSHLADHGKDVDVSRFSVDLWEQAITKLSPDKRSFLQITVTDRRKVLQEVLGMVQGAEQTCQQKRWKRKNRKGKLVILRDVFAKMVVWIEKFKSIGDSIVQYDPSHAALPWAAARFVLQVRSPHKIDSSLTVFRQRSVTYRPTVQF